MPILCSFLVNNAWFPIQYFSCNMNILWRTVLPVPAKMFANCFGGYGWRCARDHHMPKLSIYNRTHYLYYWREITLFLWMILEFIDELNCGILEQFTHAFSLSPMPCCCIICSIVVVWAWPSPYKSKLLINYSCTSKSKEIWFGLKSLGIISYLNWILPRFQENK